MLRSSEVNPFRARVPPAVASVFITDQLAERPADPDYPRHLFALRDLAGRLLDGPDELLPRLVDLAMEMCGAVAGGISLYEPEPPPGVFRWHHLRGSLERFTGGTTPRDFSPCGVTLDQRATVLVQRPERVYTWLREAEISLPECLLVPLYLGGDEPLGTLWLVSAEERHFNAAHATTMRDIADFAGIALKLVLNEGRLRAALAEQETLAAEMSHRVKNVFAIVDALIRLGAARAESVPEFAEATLGRLRALAAAHGLVRRSFEQHAAPGTHCDLAETVRTILRPYEHGAIEIDGPPVRLGLHATNDLALFLHELATNAAKHGALSDGRGALAVTWNTVDGALRIEWSESGGPRVAAAPTVKGFGSALAEKTVAGALGGTTAFDWRPEGVRVTLVAPLDRLSR